MLLTKHFIKCDSYNNYLNCHIKQSKHNISHHNISYHKHVNLSHISYHKHVNLYIQFKRNTFLAIESAQGSPLSGDTTLASARICLTHEEGSSLSDDVALAMVRICLTEEVEGES